MFEGGTPEPVLSGLPSPQEIVQSPAALCEPSNVISSGAYATMGAPVNHVAAADVAGATTAPSDAVATFPAWSVMVSAAVKRPGW